MHKYLFIFLILYSPAWSNHNSVKDIHECKTDDNDDLCKKIKISNYSYNLFDEIKLNQSIYSNPKSLVNNSNKNINKKNIATKTLKYFVPYADPFDQILNIYDTNKKLESYNSYKAGKITAGIHRVLVVDQNFKNTFTTFRIDYETGLNIFPYLEAVPFQKFSNKPMQPLSPDIKKRSTLFLIGTKIEF